MLRLISALSGAPLILSWFNGLHPVLDSISQFRLHILVFFVTVCVLALLTQRLKGLPVYVAVIAITLFLTSPFLPNRNIRDETSGTTIRIAQINMRFDNASMERALVLANENVADIFLLQEVTTNTGQLLTALKESHPHQITCPSSKVGDVAIASRYPIETGMNCSDTPGMASATVRIEGKPLTIASIHVKWPWPFGQHKHISLMADDLETLPKPHVLAGDFNSAPWSHSLRRVEELTGAKLASGLLPSWGPQSFGSRFRSVAGLPLDHILLTDGVRLLNRYELPDAGSDHAPILSIISLP